MLKSCKVLASAALCIAGPILFQPVARADNPPYSMNLYGTYNGATAVIGGEDVYISPYTAYIYQPATPPQSITAASSATTLPRTSQSPTHGALQSRTLTTSTRPTSFGTLVLAR